MHRAHLHHLLSKVLKENTPDHSRLLYCECVAGLVWHTHTHTHKKKYQVFFLSIAGFQVITSMRTDQSAGETVHLTLLYFIYSDWCS